MNALHRIAVPAVNALFITAALLYIMFLLIKTDQPELTQVRVLPPMGFIWQDKDERLIQIAPKPPRPEPVEETPDIPKTIPMQKITKIEGLKWADLNIRERMDGLPIPRNTQLILALGYPPNYPSRAITQGIEGYAIVGFSVASSGAVHDAFIVESEPNSIFDRSSLKAITKFKYKPRMVDGKAVDVSGQLYKFVYELDE